MTIHTEMTEMPEEETEYVQGGDAVNNTGKLLVGVDNVELRAGI